MSPANKTKQCADRQPQEVLELSAQEWRSHLPVEKEGAGEREKVSRARRWSDNQPDKAAPGEEPSHAMNA